MRFRCGTKVVEGLKKPKARLGYQRSSVVSNTGYGFSDPGRITGEQFIVFRGSQKSNDPQLDDKIIDNLLRLLLGKGSGRKVTLEINVKKGRCPAEGHGGTVLFFNRPQ